MQITITDDEYQELMRVKREYENLTLNISSRVDIILEKLKREYAGFIEEREELREKSIGIKILNDIIVKNYTTQILVESIKKFKIEELLKQEEPNPEFYKTFIDNFNEILA